ncbi:MAG: pyrroloquinoline quinone precursor peptide PqqA [Candidatus Rokuibacteriota bacterium]|nr:MAG: pyrroloquinoline quinone precursor peptide PqqA [Candidatus Rokubacteria bacterium]
MVDDLSEEVRPMSWEAPEFSEIKIDAEINSYQDDFAGA